MDTLIAAWGNSLGVRIPKALAQKVGLAAGKVVSVDVQKGHLVITPSSYRLEDMIADITPDNCHQAITAGGRQGKEIW